MALPATAVRTTDGHMILGPREENRDTRDCGWCSRTIRRGAKMRRWLDVENAFVHEACAYLVFDTHAS